MKLDETKYIHLKKSPMQIAKILFGWLLLLAFYLWIFYGLINYDGSLYITIRNITLLLIFIIPVVTIIKWIWSQYYFGDGNLVINSPFRIVRNPHIDSRKLEVKQGPIQKLFKYGTIIIGSPDEGAGIVLPYIKDPYGIPQRIKELEMSQTTDVSGNTIGSMAQQQVSTAGVPNQVSTQAETQSPYPDTTNQDKSNPIPMDFDENGEIDGVAFQHPVVATQSIPTQQPTFVPTSTPVQQSIPQQQPVSDASNYGDNNQSSSTPSAPQAETKENSSAQKLPEESNENNSTPNSGIPPAKSGVNRIKL